MRPEWKSGAERGSTAAMIVNRHPMTIEQERSGDSGFVQDSEPCRCQNGCISFQEGKMSALAVSSAYSKRSSGSFIDAPQDTLLLALLSQRLRQDRRVLKPGPPISRQPREIRERSTSAIDRYQALIRLIPAIDSHRSDAERDGRATKSQKLAPCPPIVVGKKSLISGCVICCRKAHFIMEKCPGGIFHPLPPPLLISPQSLRRLPCVLI